MQSRIAPIENKEQILKEIKSLKSFKFYSAFSHQYININNG